MSESEPRERPQPPSPLGLPQPPRRGLVYPCGGMTGVFSPKKEMFPPGPKEGEPLGLLQMLLAVAVLCSAPPTRFSPLLPLQAGLPRREHWVLRKANGETHSLSQEF